MSELYSSLLLLGVTISLGSVATGLITNQFGLSTEAAGAAAALGESSAGVQLSFIDATVGNPSGCPGNLTAPEGRVLEFTVFNYGTTKFTPVLIALNDTVYYSSGFPTLDPGGMATYHLALYPRGGCARAWGQTVTMADSLGNDYQLET